MDMIMDSSGVLYVWFVRKDQPPAEESWRRNEGRIETYEYLPPPSYEDYWMIVRPDNGYRVGDKIETHVRNPEIRPSGMYPLTGGSEMAIGEGGKLVLLHNTGKLLVYE
jgi:hypothetical protein